MMRMLVPTATRQASRIQQHLQSFSTALVNVIDDCQTKSLDWNNRSGLQDEWTKEEKGWTIDVEYRQTPYGVGVFSNESVSPDTILRVGLNGWNLLEFQSTEDILSFCRKSNTLSERDEEYQARLAYAKDYLWGFSLETDHYGNALNNAASERFYGMWVPGNGLNHCEPANTVYRARIGGTDEGIDLVSLTQLEIGDELTDDYRRHGKSPSWLSDFAKKHGVTLNFADCNDFV